MINKTRNIHFFTNTKFQQEYEKRFYLRVPACEDYVDKLEINTSNSYAETRFKNGLRDALKHIRVFLLTTRLTTATDFTKAFLSLADSGYIEHLNKKFKFNEKTGLEEIAVDGYYDYKNMNINISDKVLATNVSHEQTVKVLVHELMHYFSLTFNVEYSIGDNLNIKLARKQSTFAKYGIFNDSEYVEKTLHDNYGNIKSRQPIKAPILTSDFLNEGYNELLSQLIYPKGNKTYYAQVKMIELLQFVTGQDSDYNGFFRWELNNQVENLGEADFNKFVNYVDDYHTRFSKKNPSNYLTDKDYLAAQNLLVNHYIKKIINQYLKDKNASDCINKVLSLFSYIPSLQNENVEVIKNIVKSTQPNIDKTEYDKITNILDDIIEYKSQLHGKPIKLDLHSNLDIMVSRNYKNELHIYINGKVIDNENILKMSKDNGYRVFNVHDVNNKKMIDIIKSNKGLQMLICDIKGKDFTNRMQLDINLDRLETQNVITYKESYQTTKKIQLQDPSLNNKIDELIYFVTHFNDIKTIRDQFSIDNTNKIYCLSPQDENNDSEESIYMIENNKGVFEFYSKYKNTKPNRLNILNGIFAQGSAVKRQVYKPFLVESELTGELENGVVQCGEIPPYQSEIIYVLENGSVLEVFNENNNDKNILLNKKGILYQPKLTCLYSSNNELINAKEILANKTELLDERE